MLSKLRRRAEEEGGFTLIELLVVILIIGILAAIAIPSFLNQKTKANDASAKAMARSAQTAAETYSTDHNGYANMTVSWLQNIEATLNDTSSAKLTAATPNATNDGYTVEADVVNGTNKFYITRAADGSVSRTCTTGGTGSCPSGGNW